MVRNFGERKKKNKRGRQSRKSRKPPTTANIPLEADMDHEECPQEVVTCKEVAIHVPRPAQDNDEDYDNEEIVKAVNDLFAAMAMMNALRRDVLMPQDVYYSKYRRFVSLFMMLKLLSGRCSFSGKKV
ncbi:uncharacterized protein LOC100680012 [Nasonia vitripennis]|uniref:Uncharacterized protein n=1 Tax=Nasonia vitripennis TaxID=7425 RepID=A0A7M7GCX5_NASVI|nr:uncharacterized protein LOC100680012 [Nasonia vitripennis]